MKQTEIEVEGTTYMVTESPHIKTVRSDSYNYNFNKDTGEFQRWGVTFDDDPQFAPAGPEILDIEISVNGCPNACRFCSPSRTMVRTPEGDVPIETLIAGDIVMGSDGHRVKSQEIEEVYERPYEGELVDIELENGVVLSLTPNHPVILADGSEVMAGDLAKETEIVYFE